MSRKLSLSIVFILAFLQCLSPLLHAHPLGTTAVRGVHFHAGLDYVDATGRQSISQADAPVAMEFSAIRVEKPLAPEIRDFVLMPSAAVAPIFVALFWLSSRTLGKGLHRISLPHAFPFSQAPPASL